MLNIVDILGEHFRNKNCNIVVESLNINEGTEKLINNSEKDSESENDEDVNIYEESEQDENITDTNSVDSSDGSENEFDDKSEHDEKEETKMSPKSKKRKLC